MNNRNTFILACIAASGSMLAIYFTDNSNYSGFLIGFITGLINIRWLSRDTKKAIDEQKFTALRIYFRSLFSRLGMVTLVVAAVGRFRPEWLMYLALGIAAGIIIPMILSIRLQIKNGRG